MKYALFSDVHANLPALDAVLANIASREDVGATFHLGDLVGYAPWPNEVVARIAAAGIAGVAGNYDSTVATDYKHCGCQYEDPQQEALSHLSYAWTREAVSLSTKAALGALPYRIDLRPFGGHASGPTVTLVHGNQVLNTVYVHGDVVCVGHTHKPWHRTVDGVHYINTGSVGRPKDEDWRAGYVLLDVTTEGVTVEFVRVEYDIAAAMRGVRKSTLPSEFAEYLRTGGAPIAPIAPTVPTVHTRPTVPPWIAE